MNKDKFSPLAERLRPETLDEVLGQNHILGDNKALRVMLDNNKLISLILWGPAGCGKTTIARLLASKVGLHFETMSAVLSGVKEVRAALNQAEIRREQGKGTLLFIDEIHRFNKSQQDAFLHAVESGTIVLVGATTENPSFEVNSALLSRCRVFPIKSLDKDSLLEIISRAERLEDKKLNFTEEARDMVVSMAHNDGRFLLNMLEILFSIDTDKELTEKDIQNILNKKHTNHDKAGEQHYNLISAFQKSIRGSDVDAAMYYFARMVAAGEDMRYVARRLIIIASEDIGNADPQGILIASAAAEAYSKIGSPQGEICLAQAVSYLATAPKSNASYSAYNSALSLAKQTSNLNPPMHILNAPTKMMKDMGYNDGYKYDHDYPHAFSGQEFFPEEIKGTELYIPNSRGFEREIEKRLEFWKKIKNFK
ncbi:MAG: replication-associated recombination protein A [Alphaproteobacteria bacterium]|nr:replication-associated recombination protein A [Alphaproteobacteria bacterium]